MARSPCAALLVCAGALGQSVALATSAQDQSPSTHSQQATPRTQAMKHTGLTASNYVGGRFDNPTFKQDGSGTRGGCANAQPGDFEENEPFDCPGVDDPPHNGGCSDDPPSFSPLSCSQPVHGESGTFVRDGVNYRDTDWWLIEVTDSHAILTWTVTADFPVLIGLIRLPCPATQFIPGTTSTAPACTEVTSISPCLSPGQYAAFVAPSNFTGVACGSQYRGTLTCTPCAPPPPPANDNCADAQQIVCGESIHGTNIDATTDGFAPCGAAGSDVWYKFVAPREYAIVDTCNLATHMDTVLAAYDQCGGTVLDCDDDSCGVASRLVLAGLTIGETYYVSVSGFAGNQGTFLLTLGDCGPIGACCIGSECRAMPHIDCIRLGGTYQGDDTSCDMYSFSRGDVQIENISGTGSAGCSGDDCSTLVPLGFTFTYFGTDFTDINVGSNGHMRFGGPATEFDNPESLPTADGYNNVVAPYWDDWRTDFVCPGASLRTQTLGSAPNRRFIAQWTNVCHFGDSAQCATFQAILYEATDSIEYRYGPPLARSTPVVGIENGEGSAGVNVTPLPVSGESVLITVEGTGNPCGGCLGDLDDDGDRDVGDLAILLAQFGAGGPDLSGDMDGNGVVELQDLAYLLAVFGTPC